ncbi:unnamed protein product [Musa hybrid cultivar]
MLDKGKTIRGNLQTSDGIWKSHELEWILRGTRTINFISINTCFIRRTWKKLQFFILIQYKEDG